ncbi:MAG TPA: UbiA family prenyltransferase [Candidatus Bilamarchaeum sp.]|nr:UbiA family prenyltransferase [Candidatus Bilamarchaeum sp.]
MGFLGEILKLTRFEHALMLAFAVLIGETVVLGHLPAPNLILALSLLVPVFSEMGSFALNDYFDVETDRLNKKNDRPLVRGTISAKFALYFSIACIALSALLAFPINTAAFAIAVLFNAAAVAYNWKLKDLPLVGNVYIGLTMAIPFIFGNFAVAQDISPLALVLALLGFVAGIAREIIKSAQDVEGDIRARGSKTLPALIGKKASIAIAAVLYLVFIPLCAMPFMMGLGISPLPVGLVAAGDIVVLAVVFKTLKEDYKFARKFSLVAFLLGLLGLFVASL